MKKIFISYKHTGEKPETLQKTVGFVCKALAKEGHDVYCSLNDENLFREKNFSVKEILNHALLKLKKSDLVFAFVNSKDRSEGQLIELGYAYSKNTPIILAAKKGTCVHTSKSIAHKYFEFNSLKDLADKITAIKL